MSWRGQQSINSQKHFTMERVSLCVLYCENDDNPNLIYMLYQIKGSKYLLSCSCSNGYIKRHWKKIFTSGTVFVILSQFYLHLWNYLRCELKKKIIGIVIIWLAFFLLPCVSSFNSKIKMQHFFSLWVWFALEVLWKCSVEPSLAFYKYKNCCFFKYSGH